MSHALVCEISGRQFVVSKEELAIYERMGVPVPRRSPEERARIRLAWRNERTLYRRTCDATGKNIVSIFDTGAPFPVYNLEYWWTDAWDAVSYGRDFDFSRPFFEQFLELFHAVPQCAIRCPQSENCEYTNQCEKNKDCYLIFCSNGSRNCLYGMWYQSCNDCLDCTYLEKSELCYEILNGKNCYGCTESENLQGCSECHFSRELIGCSHCFGCVNLRNKEYCFFNKQLTKADYQAAVANARTNSRAARAALREEFAEFAKQYPRKYFSGKSNENFSGDYLENNKNVFDSYNCRNSENLWHCRDAWSGRNSIDLTETLDQDFCLEIEGCNQTSNSAFCAKISSTHDAWYSSHCFFVRDLFGCVGLRQKQYCILNKQYSREDYFKLKEKLIAHMKKTGEWGQYFPIEMSPFAYNESVANEYFPLTREGAISAGLKWKGADQTANVKGVTAVPDTLENVGDEILNETIICESSGKPFKLQKSELSFYRQLNLPIPTLHHNVRHQQRMNLRNARVLHSIRCDGCKQDVISTFAASATVPELFTDVVFCIAACALKGRPDDVAVALRSAAPPRLSFKSNAPSATCLLVCICASRTVLTILFAACSLPDRAASYVSRGACVDWFACATWAACAS